MNRDRRAFVLRLGVLGAAATTTGARAQAHVDEKDPQAAALGYVQDTGKVDEKKFPKHSAQQTCGGCALGQFKASEAWGNCPLFAGRQVSAKGWCSAWAKKA
jgi:hypothetical protein